MTNDPVFNNRQRLLAGLAIAGAVVLGGGIASARSSLEQSAARRVLYVDDRAGWCRVPGPDLRLLCWLHVAFRRVPEAMARIIPVACAALLAVLAVRMSRYGWHSPGEGDALTFWFKQFWLTPSFWMMRSVVYVLLWTLLSRWILVALQNQDASGDDRVAAGSQRLSAVFLAVYAVTFSLASVDWLMALDPLWFSTIWGVYNFAGMMQSALAVVIVLGLLLRSHGGAQVACFATNTCTIWASCCLGSVVSGCIFGSASTCLSGIPTCLRRRATSFRGPAARGVQSSCCRSC